MEKISLNITSQLILTANFVNVKHYSFNDVAVK